ncbi:MAG: glycosyltransferase family 4 protein [Flavobacteriaceae bacterium]
MNIGFITTEYTSSHFKGRVGGIGVFTKSIANQLVNKGHKVCVFVYGQDKNKIYSESSIKIHFVKSRKIKGFTRILTRKHFNTYVNKVIKEEKIEIIEAPEWGGITAFMSFKCPLILRLHGSDTFFCHLEKRKQKKKNFYFEKKALQQADGIIAVSEFVKTKTIELFKLSKQISVVHNTVDVSIFKPDHSNINPKTILYFGALIRKKGVLELPKIFNKVTALDSGFRLILIGKNVHDIVENKSTKDLFIEQLSQENREKVSFINHLPQEELYSQIRSAEIVVLPSFAEAFPLTWLEAMAMEKKLVTSNIGWAKELMIDEKTGYMVSPTNHETYAKKIISLQKNSKLGEEMAMNARNRIEKEFNLNTIMNRNVALYTQICKENDI